MNNKLKIFTVIVLAGAIAIPLFIAAIYVYISIAATQTLETIYDVTPAKLSIPTDQASLDHGRRLVLTSGCGFCHGDDQGGKILFDDFMLGLVAPPNLTGGKGARTGKFTDEHWVLAIRHGIGPDGRPLLFMPSHMYHHFGDSSLAAIIAYYKHIPKVDRELPLTDMGFASKALHSLGDMPMFTPAELIDHNSPRQPEAPPAETAEYGKFLSLTGGCQYCHGPGLAGGFVVGIPPGDPNFPMPSNITPSGIGEWSFEDFDRAMRKGERPDGSGIHPFMPWKYSAHFTPLEMKALWLYVKSVPAKPLGSR